MLKKWKKLLAKSIEKETFLQYIFAKQWQALKEYANEKGISIIGDAPIFVAYDSADVWANQKLFRLDSKGFPLCIAGVPPDYFSKTGQLWGNPVYKWRAHKKSGYQWWKDRMAAALKLYDVVRIDHFRAIESYWSVPKDALTAREGKWIKGPGMDFIKKIKELGFKTAAMALSDNSVSIDDPKLMGEDKLAIILGTEGDGLAVETIADCDYTVKIPMSHGVDSLNVAAASAVAFWQLGNKN